MQSFMSSDVVLLDLAPSVPGAAGSRAPRGSLWSGIMVWHPISLCPEP
jgi:hypothetical protein